MPQKYYNVKETAKVLGISEDQVKQLLDRRELYGYRDGADWKFKVEDIDKKAKERAARPAAPAAPPAPSAPADDTGDVLLSEVTLGQSDSGTSGTVIGMETAEKASAESDIRLADSDVHLAESDIRVGEEKKPAKPAAKDETGSKASKFEELDLTLDQDLTLADSGVKDGAAAAKATVAPGDSAVDLSGKKLEDDDLVLGGSGTGSDITIGGDSGISLVDPADSGLSLEEPLKLGAVGEESLELGEDDMVAFSADAGSASGKKGEDDFQLTPMPDAEGPDDSESGSQVIALDTENEGDEAATMIAGGAAGLGMAAMLDEDLSTEPTLGLAAAGMAPMTGGEMGLGAQPGLVPDAAMAQAAALPEAPYSIWNVLSLFLCAVLLVLVGIMLFDLVEHMRSWDSTHYVNSSILDWFLSFFEK